MASEPNSGPSPQRDVLSSLQRNTQNSGMRTDFLNNAAIFGNNSDIPGDGGVILSQGNEEILTQATIQDSSISLEHGELLASSPSMSRAHLVFPPQPHNDNMPDFRVFMQQMLQMMANAAAYTQQLPADDVQCVPVDKDSSNNSESDNFADDLDNIITGSYSDDGVSHGHAQRDDDNIDSDLLAELSSYFDKEEQTGPAISDALATAITKGFLSQVPKERREILLKKYNRPSNCDTLKTPRVNTAVWQHMKRYARNTDVHMQIMQSNACAVSFPLLRLTDQLHKADKVGTPLFGSELHNCLGLAMDAFKTVQLLFSEITKRRRAAIRPLLPTAYKALCSDDVPVSSLLFGDDLDKRFKELKDADNMSKTLQGPRTNRQRPPVHTPRQRWTPSSSSQPRFEPYSRHRPYTRHFQGSGTRGRHSGSNAPHNSFLGQRKPQMPAAQSRKDS